MSRCPITGVCSSEDHEALKADLAAFRALPFKDAQTVDYGDEIEHLEIRNCTCGSTLYRPCSAADVLALNAAIAIAESGEGYLDASGDYIPTTLVLEWCDDALSDPETEPRSFARIRRNARARCAEIWNARAEVC